MRCCGAAIYGSMGLNESAGSRRTIVVTAEPDPECGEERRRRATQSRTAA
jgi:hypothetical protein